MVLVILLVVSFPLITEINQLITARMRYYIPINEDIVLVDLSDIYFSDEEYREVDVERIDKPSKNQ